MYNKICYDADYGSQFVQLNQNMNKFEENGKLKRLGDLQAHATGPGLRHPFRTILIRVGITLAIFGGCCLMAGLAGIVPMTLETLGWNNIRIISGAAIFGCMMAAVGYGDE